jgi:hypothetical protein
MEKWKHFCTVEGNVKLFIAMEDSVMIPYKIKIELSCHMIQQFHVWVYTQYDWKQNVEIYFCSNVHSIIHNSKTNGSNVRVH